MDASDLTTFERDPLGRFVVGPSYVIWVDSPTLAGSAYFGPPDASEFPDLVRLFSLPAHPALATGFDALIDCSRLQAIDTAAYAFMAQYLRSVPAFAPKLRRVAIVRPDGMPGAVTAGLFADLITAHFKAALFGDLAGAFAWLDRPDGAAEHLRVATVIGDHHALPLVLRDLRDALAKDLDAQPADIAKRHALSERSLSRRLAELGTSYRAEVRQARLRKAEALLLGGDEKLDAIAHRIGFASRAHFTSFFQQLTGETPSAFRTRRRDR